MQAVARLAGHFAPAHYTLHVDLTNAARRTFEGTVKIKGALHEASPTIALHAKGLEILEVTVDGKGAKNRLDTDDVLMVVAPESLAKGDHEVTLRFSGTITDPMNGLYPCYFKQDGVDKEIFATQFESHHAREVFPCVDEPAAKATFDVTLATQPGLTVLGNMPVDSQHDKDGQMITTFGTTPKMSTYLLAFIVGELGYRETTSGNGVTIRAFATKDHVPHTQFALEHAAKVLDFYDEYFGMPFPLPKLDLVALPDFSSGAMENWGLNTYREAALLVDPENTPADSKQWIATVVAHELAHQWFGNLVTMEWWDDLWLNESFANWMEYYATGHFYPEWQLWEQYTASDKQIALSRDGLADIQSVRQPVNHPDEIRSLFDYAIVYAKGSSLLNMLHEYLGDEPFRNGLRLYMQRHQYGNTKMSDLWDALSSASGKDVSAFIQPWITQPGHPVVKVEIKGDTLQLSQRRFYSHPAKTHAKDSTIWPVPVLNSAVSDELLAGPTMQTKILPESLVMLNKGGSGFYHTQYQPEQLHAIAKAVGSDVISVIDRQSLLFDSLYLTRAGHSSTLSLLDLLDHYRHESNYTVWNAMSSVIGSLKTLVNDDPKIKPHLQKFVATIARQEFERLGWERQKDETYFDELQRPTIVGSMVYAEVPAVIDHAVALFSKASKPEDLPADLRGIIYTAAIRVLGKPAYDKMLDWYKTTKSADERTTLCAGITAMRDTSLIAPTLDLITTKTVKLQDAFYWFIYLMRNPVAKDAAWEWMTTHWDWIKKNFGSDLHYDDFPRYAASGLITAEDLAKFTAFFTPKLNEPALAKKIKQGIEEIEVRMLWRERDLADITAYLAKAAKS